MNLCILTDDALSFIPEAGGAQFVPPLIDISLLVKLFSFVIKAVGNLVTNHHADSPEVQRFRKELRVLA